jgi:hypothetical protein
MGKQQLFSIENIWNISASVLQKKIYIAISQLKIQLAAEKSAPACAACGTEYSAQFYHSTK